MTMRTRNPLLITVIALVIAALVILSGCKNFMSGDEDIRKAIEEEVIVANAAKVDITVRAEDDDMGVTSPLGVTEVKVGVAFDITTTVSSEYVFVGWTQVGGDGDEITFADASSMATTAILNKAVTDNTITIRPVFDRRPYVVTWTPFSGSDNILINKAIVVTLSEPILASSVILTGDTPTVSITTVKTAKIATETPKPVQTNFSAAINGSSLTLSLNSGVYHDIYSTITVTIAFGITDLAGNEMEEDFTWFFKTGSGKDVDPPTITSLTVTNDIHDLGTTAYTKSQAIT
jgi:hypothetical protein